MTKEEALDKIIEYCKNGSKTPVSDFCRIPCSICPFNNEDCENDVVDSLFEQLIKAEEHQETNLEHYCRTNGYMGYDVEKFDYVISIRLDEDAYQAYQSDEELNIPKWLLSPYEKPKYKLSKFEYDLLNAREAHWYSLNSLSFLERLIAKGYFKNIPTDISIKDILDNCEVVD